LLCCVDDDHCGFVPCVDADGRRGSCSRESTPLHADWPPASLSIPAQQFDQSQDGHLSGEPLPPGVDTFSAAEAGQFGGSCLPEEDQYLRTKDSSQALERQMIDTKLSKEADQPVPDSILSSPLRVVDDGTEHIQSARIASQETRTMTMERSSVQTILDDMSGSAACVPVPSWSELSSFSQEQLVSRSERRDTAASTQQATVSISDQQLPSSATDLHLLPTPGTALQHPHSASSRL